MNQSINNSQLIMCINNKNKILFLIKSVSGHLHILILILLFLSGSVYCQDEQLIPSVPLTPEVAEFTRFLEFPISLYSGSIDITIPIYSIEVDKVNISLELKYNSTGVKVEEEASWVGLGWSLFTGGGVISRQVRGRADESEYGWRIADYWMPPYPSDFCGSYETYYHQNTYVIQTHGNGDFVGCNYYEAGYSVYFQNPDNTYDFEPDIYSYSFNGYSGTFSFDINGNLIKHEYTPIEINRLIIDDSDPEEVYWQIIDLSGNIFEFSTSQSTSVYTRATNLNKMEAYVTSWFLNKITTSNGHTINFKYSRSSSTITIPSFSETYDCLNYSEISRSYNYSTYYPEHLSEINTSDGNTIKFYKSNRRDIENGKKLDSIHVYNIQDDLVKNFRFDYDYFIAPSSVYELSITSIEDYIGYFTHRGYTQQQAKDTTNVRNRYRLKLNGFCEVNNSNSEKIGHSFDYHPVPLPSKTSFSVDYWGYFNGASNTTKIPTYINYVDYFTAFGHYYLDDFVVRLKANRHANANYGKACLLEGIIYPTGGSMQIDYEPHQITNYSELEPYDAGGNPITIGEGGGYRVKSMIKSDPVSGKTIRRNYHYYNGILLHIPKFVKQNISYAKNAYIVEEYSTLWVSAYSNSLSSNVISNSKVGYSKVEEEVTDGASISNLTEYTYYNDSEVTFKDISHFGGKFLPSVPIYENGLLKTKIEKDEIGEEVHKITYNYSFTEQCQNFGLKISYYRTYQAANEFGVNLYHFSFYKLKGQRSLLNSVEEIIDGVTNLTSYSYNDNNLYSTVTTKDSKGQTFINNILYPDDYNSVTSGFIDEMKTANILNRPIEQYTILGDKITKGIITEYGTGSELGLPIRKYKLITDEPLQQNAPFHPSNYNGYFSINNSYYLPELNYDAYDGGKLLQYHKSNDINVSYLWGYNNTLLVAKVENAASDQILYESFESSFYSSYHSSNSKTGKYSYANAFRVELPSPGVYILTYWEKENGNDWQFRKQRVSATTSIGGNCLIDEVRLYPKDALMTTYTYDPLIGVTSITDSKDMTTHYEYDVFHRLKTIRDANGKILESYDYHYYNDNE